jgi:hypothetical protein
MDLAQLVHQLGPHGRTAVAEQLDASAEFFRKGQIFVTQAAICAIIGSSSMPCSVS